MMLLDVFGIGAFFLVFVFAFYWIYAILKGAPYYPSSGKAQAQMLEEILKQENPKVVELGAGDGRLAIRIARKGIPVTAIEINPILSVMIRLLAVITRTKGLRVINSDFLRCDLSEYNVAVAYLYPGIMQKLEPKLFSEMKPGSLIISNTFAIKSREPIKRIEVKGAKILIYKVGG
jgi:hypothetical protein